MRIDCFIMNPPYGTQDNPQLCCRIMKPLKKYRAVVISPPPPIFNAFYFNVTSIEQVKFPGIDMATAISTINDNKPKMFEKKYKYKTSNTPTQFYIHTRQPFAGSMKTKYGLKVRKIGVEKECGDKTYLKLTDTEREFINKLIDETDLTFWTKLFQRSQNGPRFLVPNLLAKTKYAYLVEEVKNNED